MRRNEVASNIRDISGLIDRFITDSITKLEEESIELFKDKERLAEKYRNTPKEDARENGVLDALQNDIASNNMKLSINANKLSKLQSSKNGKQYNSVGICLPYATILIEEQSESKFTGAYRIMPGDISYPDIGKVKLGSKEISYGIMSELAPVSMAAMTLGKGETITIGGTKQIKYKIIDIY